MLSKTWMPGPLPVETPSRSDLKDRLTSRSTTADARLTAVDGGAGELLYASGLGVQEDAGILTGRHHVAERLGELGSLSFFACEFLSQPPIIVSSSPESAILAVHFTGGRPKEGMAPEAHYLDNADDLRALRFWNPELPDGHTAEWSHFLSILSRVIPAGWSLTSVRSRVITLTHAPELLANTNQSLESDHLQYLLVAGISPGRLDVTSERLDELRVTPRKIGWHALVMRDGLSFSLPRDDSLEFLRVYCHTIFLDVLLLAQTQMSAIREFDENFRKRSIADAAQLLSLEISYFNFKRLIWFDSMTRSKQKPMDVILQRMQEQSNMHYDAQRFAEDITEASRLASSLQARAAATQADKIQESQERMNSLVQVLTALLAPIGLCYTGAAVLFNPSVEAFVVTTSIGAATTGVLLAALQIQRRRHQKRNGL